MVRCRSRIIGEEVMMMTTAAGAGVRVSVSQVSQSLSRSVSETNEINEAY